MELAAVEGGPGAMKTEKEIREETRRVRERAKGLSGFWVAELSSAAQALEWALGKQAHPPSEDIGGADSAQGRIAASMVKAAEKAGAPPGPEARPRKTPGATRRRP
jgi:hypothetical protein